MRRQKGFTLIELLIVVAIIGIIAAIAIPNLLNALNRGRQKRSMADMRSIGTAIEEYQVDNNFYPKGLTGTSVQTFIEPTYIKRMPDLDGWNHAFDIYSDTAGADYTINCGGRLGGAAAGAVGPTTSFDAAITFSDGQFVQWPEGSQI